MCGADVELGKRVSGDEEIMPPFLFSTTYIMTGSQRKMRVWGSKVKGFVEEYLQKQPASSPFGFGEALLWFSEAAQGICLKAATQENLQFARFLRASRGGGV